MSGTASEVMARLDALAGCTDTPGAITRLFLTPAHRRAVDLVRGWMEQAGLRAALDASATLVGRAAGPDADAPVVILGSHIDTVRDAGRYDGCLGVVAAIALAARLRGAALPYALEIRAFGDEEGVRFPVTLTGARATAGLFDPAALDASDADGVILGAALRAWGLDPAALAGGACTAVGACAYLELHIEQGPVLEAAGAPLGVVTAISGAARFAVTVQGAAGHAGTVPMDQRRDALVAAAQMVLAVRDVARRRPGLVATVGQLAVAPGAVNVIPRDCTFSIDLRAPDDPARHAAAAELHDALSGIAAAHRVGLRIAATHQAPAVPCDPRWQAALAAALRTMNLPAPHLPSGAGHDAMAIAGLCPVGMLFVRCAGGISHDPAESVREDDVAAALDVMEHVLRRFDPAA